MSKIKKILVLVLVVFASILLIACERSGRKSKYPLEFWQTPGYKQGDHGNVPTMKELKDKTRQLAPKPYTTVNGMEKPVKWCTYYEVNDTNPLHAASLTIGQGENAAPLIDKVILFAANINNGGTTSNPWPKLHFNENVTEIVKNPDKYIKPLQAKGIKVVMDVLPNHQGYGYFNLDETDRKTFIDQLVEAVDKFGLDGLDFDEEYAKYGKLPNRPQSPDYLVSFAKELKDRLPNKEISWFWYGFGGTLDTKTLLGKIDNAWPNYGTSANPISVEPKNWAYRSIEFSHGIPSAATFRSYAKKIKELKYGWIMTFNVANGKNGVYDFSAQASGFTQELYGENTYCDGVKYYKDWE